MLGWKYLCPDYYYYYYYYYYYITYLLFIYFYFLFFLEFNKSDPPLDPSVKLFISIKEKYKLTLFESFNKVAAKESN